jgi:TusA-related sulfurtransferase
LRKVVSWPVFSTLIFPGFHLRAGVEVPSVAGKYMGDLSDSAEEVDARGLRCPLPLLKTRQALRHLRHGKKVRVLTDDPASAHDIPRWLAGSEHELLEQENRAEVFVFLIRC